MCMMLWRCIAVALWVYFTLYYVHYSSDRSVRRYGHASLLLGIVLGLATFAITQLPDAGAPDYHCPRCDAGLR